MAGQVGKLGADIAGKVKAIAATIQVNNCPARIKIGRASVRIITCLIIPGTVFRVPADCYLHGGEGSVFPSPVIVHD